MEKKFHNNGSFATLNDIGVYVMPCKQGLLAMRIRTIVNNLYDTVLHDFNYTAKEEEDISAVTVIYLN